MPNLSPQAQSLIDGFRCQRGVSTEQADNLQTLFEKSPALTDQLNEAVDKGHLIKFEPLTNPNMGGSFTPDKKSIQVSLASLNTPPPRGPFEPGEAIFVMGHELQHSFNAKELAQTRDVFWSAVHAISKSDTPKHDYTEPLRARLAAHRGDEASAEISGWNATVSAVKADHAGDPKYMPTLEDVYLKAPRQMKDFIDQTGSYPYFTYTLKPNLSLNTDFTMSPQHNGMDNLEAMGKNFFDKSVLTQNGVSYGFGPKGSADYANYYGADAINYVIQQERLHGSVRNLVFDDGMGIFDIDPKNPGMVIDMGGLRLERKQLEEKGLTVEGFQPMPFEDPGSQKPGKVDFFHNTSQTNTYVPSSPGEKQAPAQTHEEPSRDSTATPGTASPSATSGDFLENYLNASQRGDSAAQAALAEQHAQTPEMQALAQWGRELYQAEQERLLTAQQALEPQNSAPARGFSR
jgi:hypothetical protein